MGSNMAENHPVAFRFVVEAQRRGGKVIHVDPRFTRTSALADIHAHMRSGSDIAFLGGLINYVLVHDLWWREYAMAYTNIAMIVDEGYEDPETLDGVFSGFNTDAKSYTQDTWQPRGEVESSASGTVEPPLKDPPEGAPFESMKQGPAPTDPTLTHPNCVYQILRRHYARYTPEMVERVCGVPAAHLRAHRPDPGAELRARAHHRHLLRGRLDAPDGGRADHPRRGHAAGLDGQRRAGRAGGSWPCAATSRSRGSTDIPTLSHSLPGYLAQPRADDKHKGPGELPRARDAGHRLAGQHAQVRREPAQGLVRRRRHRRQRVGLRQPAQAPGRRQPGAHAPVHGQRAGQGRVHLRAEPGGGLGQRQDHRDGPGQAGMAGWCATSP